MNWSVNYQTFPIASLMPDTASPAGLYAPIFSGSNKSIPLHSFLEHGVGTLVKFAGPSISSPHGKVLLSFP